MRRIHRSRTSKVLGGVAAGFAEYFGTDVTVMRLLFALVAVTIPNAILAYILAWIIIPEETLQTGGKAGAGVGNLLGVEGTAETGQAPATGESQAGGSEDAAQGQARTPQSGAPQTVGHPDRNRQLFGYILIAVGGIVLARRYIPSFIWRLPTHLVGQLWPVLIIVVGAALILGAIRGR